MARKDKTTPRRLQLNVRVSPAVRRDLNREARSRKISLNDLVIWVLKRHLYEDVE